MDKAYVEIVRLLLTVAPEVFRGGVFARKGGTTLNLFVHDMPRLSVDIDLAYPTWTTQRDEALRALADELATAGGSAEPTDRQAAGVSHRSGTGRARLVARHVPARGRASSDPVASSEPEALQEEATG